VVCFCDYPNEPSASINLRKFLDQLLSEDLAPGSSTSLHGFPTVLFQISVLFAFGVEIAEFYCSLPRVVVETTQFCLPTRTPLHYILHISNKYIG
jgi:hypothetical protein